VVVELESRLVGLDGNGYWLSVEGSLELTGLFANIVVVGDGDLTLGLVIFARTSPGVVFVVRFEHEWVRLKIGEGVVHETTVATMIVHFVAVNKLLLGEGEELTLSNEVSTLNTTGG